MEWKGVLYLIASLFYKIIMYVYFSSKPHFYAAIILNYNLITFITNVCISLSFSVISYLPEHWSRKQQNLSLFGLKKEILRKIL